MSKPDFQAMSRNDLHAYVLRHREDEEAFYTYVDRLHTEATWIEMPPLKSVEDLEQHPEFLKRVSNGLSDKPMQPKTLLDSTDDSL